MDSDVSWQARHDELRATLERTGAILGDKQAPAEERDAAASEFIEVWRDFARHLRENPDANISTRPR